MASISGWLGCVHILIMDEAKDTISYPLATRSVCLGQKLPVQVHEASFDDGAGSGCKFH